MKVGIITMNGLLNIGNRLQNYAVQELLKDRGCDVITILYSLYDENVDIKSRLKTTVYNILLNYGIVTSDFYIKRIKKDPRMLLVKRFTAQYIKTTNKYFFKTHCMEKYADDFDYYCAGSDQVWNASLVQNRDFFFMRFAPSETTFSMAASMGTTYIPDEYRDTYLNGFRHVGNISVREDSVKNLIGHTVGRDVDVLLDPTLLIDKDKWLSLAVKPRIDVPQRYIATYFLSEITQSQKTYMEKYAQSNGLRIIDLNGFYHNDIGPLEFLYMMANAEFVFTDSFHGTAFSIIFDRDFVVFQRNKTYDMSSRITTILDTFGIQNRFYNCNNETIDDRIFSLIDEIKNSDSSHIPGILDQKKKEAQDFLSRVFSEQKR